MRILNRFARHAKYAEAASAYVDGALPEREAARFDAHLRGCETCRVRVADFRAMHRSLAAMPAVRATRSFRLTEAMVAEGKAVTAYRAPSRALRVAQVAAGIAVLGFVGTFTAGLLQGSSENDSAALTSASESGGDFGATGNKSQAATQDSLAPAVPTGAVSVVPIATQTPTVIAASGAGANGTTITLPSATPTAAPRPPATGPGFLFATQTAVASASTPAEAPAPGDTTPAATPRPPSTGPGDITPIPTEVANAYNPNATPIAPEGREALSQDNANPIVGEADLEGSRLSLDADHDDASGVNGLVVAQIALGALALVAIGSVVLLSRRTR